MKKNTMLLSDISLNDIHFKIQKEVKRWLEESL